MGVGEGRAKWQSGRHILVGAGWLWQSGVAPAAKWVGRVEKASPVLRCRLEPFPRPAAARTDLPVTPLTLSLASWFDTGWKLLATLGLVALNGFFVAAEFASVGGATEPPQKPRRRGQLSRPPRRRHQAQARPLPFHLPARHHHRFAGPGLRHRTRPGRAARTPVRAHGLPRRPPRRPHPARHPHRPGHLHQPPRRRRRGRPQEPGDLLPRPPAAHPRPAAGRLHRPALPVHLAPQLRQQPAPSPLRRAAGRGQPRRHPPHRRGNSAPCSFRPKTPA